MLLQNQELARQFKEKVTECQNQLDTSYEDENNKESDSQPTFGNEETASTEKKADISGASAQESDHSYNFSEADKSGYEQSGGEADQSGYSEPGAEGGNDDDEYETDEEEELQLLFSKRATMSYEDVDHSWKVHKLLK